MDSETRNRFMHMLDFEKQAAHDVRDTTRVRECIAFCQGIILTLIATDADHELELYAQKTQGDMYNLWNELNNVRQL